MRRIAPRRWTAAAAPRPRHRASAVGAQSGAATQPVAVARLRQCASAPTAPAAQQSLAFALLAGRSARPCPVLAGSAPTTLRRSSKSTTGRARMPSGRGWRRRRGGGSRELCRVFSTLQHTTCCVIFSSLPSSISPPHHPQSLIDFRRAFPPSFSVEQFLGISDILRVVRCRRGIFLDIDGIVENDNQLGSTTQLRFRTSHRQAPAKRRRCLTTAA